MGQNWYYANGDQQAGPISFDQLRQLHQAGQVHGTTLVWTEGLTQWVPANSIPELTSLGMPFPTSPGQPMPVGVLGYANQMFGHPEYAGFWLRFVAAFIDGLITGVAGGIVGGIIGGIAGASGIRPNTPEWIPVQLLLYLVGIVIGWMYCALMESSATQATLGKMALGLKVTDEAGNRIGFGKATGRHFGKWISGLILLIGYMMAGWTEKKQALHDMMAGTLVVKKIA